MVALAMLSYNLASGLMFGSFGTLLVAIEHDKQVARSLSAAGAPLVILAIGIISPFIGRLLARYSIRAIIITGALLSAAGYTLAALAPGITLLLAAYGLLIGPGVALMGLAVPPALVANWYVTGRGRAIGIVNMPLVVAFAPLVCAAILPRTGLSGLYFGMAAIMLLAIPLLALIIDHPQDIGQHPLGGEITSQKPPPFAIAPLLRDRGYWQFGLAAAILAAGGATMVTHIMVVALGRGIPPGQAAMLMSVLGVAGVAGSLGYGWLADRLGGGRALALNCAVQALLWGGLLLPLGFAPLFIVVALIGINAGGMMPALGMALSQRFGTASFGGALGFWSLMNLPFTVGLPLLAGVMFSQTGSYSLSFTLQIDLLILAAIGAALAARLPPYGRGYGTNLPSPIDPKVIRAKGS
jgi:cyanate permease